MNINKKHYLHYSNDGSLQGITGFDTNGDFFIFKDLENETKLEVRNKNLNFGGNRICIDNICLSSSNLKNLKDMYQMSTKNYDIEFLEDHKVDLKNKDLSETKILKLCKSFFKYYHEISSYEEKKDYIDRLCFTKIKIPKLGILVENKLYHDIDGIFDYNIEKFNAIDINYYKIFNFNGRAYCVSIDIENTIFFVVFYIDKSWKFAIYNKRIVNELDDEHMYRLRKNNLEIINRLDSTPIDRLKKIEFRAIINNLKQLSIYNGVYSPSSFLNKIVANPSVIKENINLDLILFELKQFELEDLGLKQNYFNDDLEGLKFRTIHDKGIKILDNLVLKIYIIKGVKKDTFSSNFKIYILYK